MNTHDFIVKQVRERLEKEGFKEGVAFIAAEDALEFYKRSASFKKNAIEECIKYAKKKAKEMASSGRKPWKNPTNTTQKNWPGH